MNLILITIFLILLIYNLNKLIIKINHLSNYKGYKHQKFVGFKNVPLSGGLYLLLSCVILIYFSNYSNLLSIFLFLIFITGFISDINLLSSPKFRFLIQTIVVIFFIISLDVKVHQTKFYLLDMFLQNSYFKYFFSVFCFLVLINGTNFIDGLNGLMLGYFILILLIIFSLNIYVNLDIEKNLIISFLIILVSLFILNISNKLFMGDGGAYVLGLLFGYFLVKSYEINPSFSPYFILHLFWYPCFENLFSILRKFSLKKSPVNADNNHLHQLIFFYFKKKLDFNNFKINNISSFIIIFYNLFIFSISLININNSKFQITLISFNIIIYLIIYVRLFNFRYKIKY